MPAPKLRQPQRRLTNDESAQVAAIYRAGSSMNQLALEFRVHRTTIAACLRKLEVPLRRQGIAPDEIDAVAALYQAGWSLARLGESYRCTDMTVRAALMRHGVEIRPRNGWKYGAPGGRRLL